LDTLAESLARKQWIGMAGAAAAFLALFLLFHFAPSLFAGVKLPSDDPASRLAYAAQWLLAPGLTLLAGVWAAARRGFLRDAIDGTRTPLSHSLEINLRYNHNTVEQTMLAAIAWTSLSLTLPRERLCLIPAMAAAFVLGRITFWIGYLVLPMGRAFGMTLTAVPSVTAYGWLLWRLVARG
jgi:hypothetical protein